MSQDSIDGMLAGLFLLVFAIVVRSITKQK